MIYISTGNLSLTLPDGNGERIFPDATQHHKQEFLQPLKTKKGQVFRSPADPYILLGKIFSSPETMWDIWSNSGFYNPTTSHPAMQFMANNFYFDIDFFDYANVTWKHVNHIKYEMEGRFDKTGFAGITYLMKQINYQIS